MKNQNGEYNMDFSEWTAILFWIAGVVVAKGIWPTFFAIIFPPWAWYLFLQHMFRLVGWL